jgi:hypothetical protein
MSLSSPAVEASRAEAAAPTCGAPRPKRSGSGIPRSSARCAALLSLSLKRDNCSANASAAASPVPGAAWSALGAVLWHLGHTPFARAQSLHRLWYAAFTVCFAHALLQKKETRSEGR